MRKKFLLMTFLLAIIGFCGTSLSAQVGLQITTEQGLRDFAVSVNEGNSYYGEVVTLANDITLTGEWTPIGTGSRSSKSYSGNAFKGTFDGGNKTISGLTITSTSGADAAVGLFGIVDGGTVKNLNLTDVNINVTNSNLAGAAIGMMLNGATADYITVSGTIIGYDGVGGIVGRLIIDGTISNCINNASVTSSYGGIGGIVGKAYYEDGANTSTFASVTKCTNKGTVTAPMYIGGIAGLARANVTDCINEGAIVGGTQTGGIVGQLIAAGTVSGNENKAKVSGKNHLGGIIGDYSQSSAYTYYNVSIANNINRGELAATEQCAAIMGCNNIDGFTAMTATGNVSYYYVEGLELFGNPEDMIIDETNKFIIPVAKIDDVEYSTLAEAVEAAKSGDEIIMLSDATLDSELTLPAGIKFNGNGKQINGSIWAAGDFTFVGHTKVSSFNAGYNKPVITISEGACLEIIGTGRMVIGHGATFNINGNIVDAKTADKATLTPSLVMPGASFTGAGVTFNVTNAYISAPSSYCSSSSSASGTFDFNITNSIWESAGKLAFESQSTAATVNFDLVESVLNTGSHLVFGVSRGEVVIDNSNVNVGTSRQIENQSTMTIKNGSVVNGAVATSSNAKNPGTLIVEDATYAVTGEFSGSDLGTGTLIMKNGASFTAGSITKANIQIDATGMAIGDVINLTANLTNLAGTLEVINNDNLDAEIKDGKIVLVEKPVAKIGETEYATLQAALDAAAAGTGNVTVEILRNIDLTGIDWNPVTVSGPGYPSVTVNGNEYTITGLNDMLFAGTWAGNSGLIINDLTIANSTIVNDENDANGNIGVGAFIGFPQASATITLNNCHLVNSTVKGGHWTGGLIGYAAGYAGTDGPVFMNLTITGCSVTGSTITGKGSAGGIIGHGSGNAWTNVVIKETTVSGNNITSTGTSTNKAGAIMGTIGAAGQPTTVNGVTHTGGATVSATVSGNTVTSGDTTITTIYGRQGTTTGILELNGGTYDNYPIEEDVTYAAPAEGFKIEVNEDGTYGVVFSAVAQIGTKYYSDLHEAMVAAKSGETVKLVNDVDLADTEWEPVNFKGIFDGQDHTISNLTINKPGVSNTGFITSLNGTFKNVTFTNPTVTGGENTAVVAGRAGGAAALAENITINGTIKVETTHSGYARAGGIVGGWAYGNYKNITVDGGDKATSYIKHTGGGDGRYVAGIVGHADGVDSYTNCTVKNITISGGWLCGGIAGPGPSDDLASGCSVENIDMKADYSGGMFGWYYGNGTVKDATVKDVTFTDGSTNNGIIGGYGQNTDANVENLTYENVQNSNGAPLLDHVASIGNNHYFTFEAALDAVQNGETITLLNRKGSEIRKEIDFTEEIEFTITGTAPNYALPIITFQNATVNIEDANFQIPELDARQNATINVINSTIVDAGGNSIVKSYYNGAINIDANSTVYAMQVTTMGYITVAGTLNATWQTNVYGNGLITLNEGATFNTAALHLTAQDYSGRDNTDAERVGKPAEIVVDGANFTVGNVHSAGGADYSYNSSHGINVGTVEGKSAILNIKNGGNVNIYMANGETANIGAGGTVNIAASTLNTICRSAGGTVTLANNGTVYVTGAANLAAANVTGAGWFYMNGVTLDADTKLSGAKVGFINGENTIVGSTIDNGFFSVGIGQNAAATTAAAFAEANGITLGKVTVNVSENAIIGGNGETYSGWVGSAYSADKTQHTYTLNVENSLAAFGYMHVSKDGAMTINGHSVNKYTHDNANVDFYAGDLIVNGNVTINDADAWVKYTKMSADHADGVLNITGDTNYESSIHNGSTTGTSLVFYKAGKVNIAKGTTIEIDNATTLVEGAELNIASSNVIAKGAVTDNGTINLTDLDAIFTAQEGLTVNNGVEGNTDSGVVYVNGAYQFANYVAQIGDDKYLTLAEAINAVENGNTITLIGTDEFAENILAGNENLKPLNKVFTIDGDNHVVTGNWRFGRDDHNTDLSEITIKNVNFKGNGISILDFYKVTISECTFNDITTGNAIYVSADEYTSSIVVENCEMNNIEGAGINFRNPVNATVKGNKINGTGNNSITFQHGTAYTEAETGEYIIENNIFQNWANEASEGRALRIATGVKPRAITIENNVMIKDNAPEEFVKVTGNTDNVSVDENYWNGANPTSSNTPAYFLAEGVQVHNYYAAYDAVSNTLSDLVTIEGAGETLEIFYTAAGEVTEQANAAYSLMFTVTDYARKEVSVKIGSKKPVQNSNINLVTPSEVQFEDLTFNVTSVANSAFNGTSFKKVTISEGVKTIGNKALYFMSKLTELVLPKTLVSVGEQCIAAYNPNSVPLKSIVCYAEEAPSAFEPTSNASFQTCVEQQTMLIVPNAADYTVYSNASGWKFTNILGIGSTKEIAGKDDKYTLLATVTSMNPMECSIKIGNTKPAANSNAELVIPETVTFFEGYDFNVTSIPNNAFKGCNNFVGNLVIPATVRTIGYMAFNASHNSNAGALIFAENCELTTIDAWAFNAPFKGNFQLPTSLTSVGVSAFSNNGEGATLTITAGNKGYGRAFSGSKFNKLVVKEGVESLPGLAFYNTRFTEVELPSTLTNIAEGAFDDNTSITTITSNNPVPPTVQVSSNYIAFEQEVFYNATLFVPDHAAKALYKEANVWKEFVNISTPIITQTTQLNTGWNWFSYYVNTDLETLETALGENGVQITGKLGFKFIEGGNWYGTLTSISPDQMYLINVNGNINLALTGETFEKVEVTLNPKWNWIGYPSNVSISVNDALDDLTPQINDQITGKEGFATYFGNTTGWVGTLQTLEPGRGYKYHSNNTDIVTFEYTNSRGKGEVKANVTTDGNHWIPNAGQYPNNMTMTAMVEVEGGDYEVAAFVDGEVRGSARPIYVEALDAHILFLTIHGDETEEMTFRYYDIATGEEYELNDRINYSNDAIVGSLKEPYIFNRGTTGIGEAAMSEVNIYPNPTTTGTEINLQATCDTVEVFNALGVKVAEYHNVDSIDAFETAGIYVIRITDNGDVKHCRLIVK